MKVRYLNLSVSDTTLKEDLLDAVSQVLDHGQIVLGPEVEEFETKIAGLCGRGHAVGVNSGTSALYMALKALEIGPGDEVITTPLSWIATLNAIVLAGATPVFTDIGEDLNINANLIRTSLTPRTKAILPVHFTGKMCDMATIMDISKDNNILIVEDAAQAFGAKLNGKKAGELGHVACFSMNAMKVLHSYGEAGAVLTDDMDLKSKIVALRYNGTINKEDCHYTSLNFRLQTIQAAMLLVELKRLNSILETRRRIARFYDSQLTGVVMCPKTSVNEDHSYYTYTIIAEKRDELRDYLVGKGIETKIHHPILMPNHTVYKKTYRPYIPVADRLVKKIVSIPNHEKMVPAEIEYVAASIRQFYGA